MLPPVKGIFSNPANYQCTNNSGKLLWTKIAVSADIAYKNLVKKQHFVFSERPNLSSLSAGVIYSNSEYVLNEGFMSIKYLSANINLKLGGLSFITSPRHPPPFLLLHQTWWWVWNLNHLSWTPLNRERHSGAGWHAGGNRLRIPVAEWSYCLPLLPHIFPVLLPNLLMESEGLGTILSCSLDYNWDRFFFFNSIFHSL